MAQQSLDALLIWRRWLRRLQTVKGFAVLLRITLSCWIWVPVMCSRPQRAFVSGPLCVQQRWSGPVQEARLVLLQDHCGNGRTPLTKARPVKAALGPAMCALQATKPRCATSASCCGAGRQVNIP